VLTRQIHLAHTGTNRNERSKSESVGESDEEPRDSTSEHPWMMLRDLDQFPMPTTNSSGAGQRVPRATMEARKQMWQPTFRLVVHWGPPLPRIAE